MALDLGLGSVSLQVKLDTRSIERDLKQVLGRYESLQLSSSTSQLKALGSASDASAKALKASTKAITQVSEGSSSGTNGFEVLATAVTAMVDKLPQMLEKALREAQPGLLERTAQAVTTDIASNAAKKGISRVANDPAIAPLLQAQGARIEASIIRGLQSAAANAPRLLPKGREESDGSFGTIPNVTPVKGFKDAIGELGATLAVAAGATKDLFLQLVQLSRQSLAIGGIPKIFDSIGASLRSITEGNPFRAIDDLGTAFERITKANYVQMFRSIGVGIASLGPKATAAGDGLVKLGVALGNAGEAAFRDLGMGPLLDGVIGTIRSAITLIKSALSNLWGYTKSGSQASADVIRTSYASSFDGVTIDIQAVGVEIVAAAQRVAKRVREAFNFSKDNMSGIENSTLPQIKQSLKEIEEAATASGRSIQAVAPYLDKRTKEVNGLALALQTGALSKSKLSELKEIAASLEIMPTGNKTLKTSWLVAIADYVRGIEGGAERVSAAWERTDDNFDKVAKSLRATADTTGEDLVEKLNHSAADTVAAAWRRTEVAFVQVTSAMVATAEKTGRELVDKFKDAFAKIEVAAKGIATPGIDASAIAKVATVDTRKIKVSATDIVALSTALVSLSSATSQAGQITAALAVINVAAAKLDGSEVLQFRAQLKALTSDITDAAKLSSKTVSDAWKRTSVSFKASTDAMRSIADATGEDLVEKLNHSAADTVAAAWRRTQAAFGIVTGSMEREANEAGKKIVDDLFDARAIEAAAANMRRQMKASVAALEAIDSQTTKGIFKLDLGTEREAAKVDGLLGNVRELAREIKATNFNKYDAMSGGFPKVIPSLAVGGAVFGGALAAGALAINAFRDQAIQAFRDVASAITGFTNKALREASKISGSLNAIKSITQTQDTTALEQAIVQAGVASTQETGAIAAYAVQLAKSGLNQKEVAAALKPIAIASDASGEGLKAVGKATISAANAYGFAAKDLGKVAGSLIAASTSAQGASIKGYGKFSQYFKVTSARQEEAIKTSASIYSLLKSGGAEDAAAGRNIASFFKTLANPTDGQSNSQSEINATLEQLGKKERVSGFDASGKQRNELDSIMDTVKAYRAIKAARSDETAAQLFGGAMGVEALRQIRALSLQTEEQIAKTLDNVNNKLANTNLTDQFYKQALSGLAGAQKLLDGAIDGFTASYGLSISGAAATVTGLLGASFAGIASDTGVFDPLRSLSEQFEAFGKSENFKILASELQKIGSAMLSLLISGVVDIIRDLGAAFGGLGDVTRTVNFGLGVAVNSFLLMAGGMKNLIVAGKEFAVLFTSIFDGTLVGSAGKGNPLMMDLGSDFTSGLKDMQVSIGLVWDALKDVFGLLLPPLLTGVGAAFKLLGIAVRFVAAPIASIARILAMITSVTIYRLAGAFKIAVSFVEPLLRLMSGGFEAVNQVVAVFTRLFTAAITEASRLLTDISRAIDAIVGTPIAAFVNGINSSIATMVSSISGFIPVLGRFIGGVVTVIRKPQGVIGPLLKSYNAVVGVTGKVFGAVASNGVRAFLAFGNTLASAINPFLGAYSRIVQSLGSNIVGFYARSFEGIRTLLKSGNFIATLERITGVTRQVADDVLQVILVLGDNIATYWDSITSIFSKGINIPTVSMPSFGKEASGIYNSFATPLQAVGKALEPIASAIGSILSSITSSAITDVVSFATYAFKELQGILQLILETLAPLGQTLAQAFEGAWSGIVRDAGPVFNEVVILFQQLGFYATQFYQAIKPMLPILAGIGLAIAGFLLAPIIAPLLPVLGLATVAIAGLVGQWEVFKVLFVASVPLFKVLWITFVGTLQATFNVAIAAITIIWETFKIAIIATFTVIKVAWAVLMAAIVLPWQAVVALFTGDWGAFVNTLKVTFGEIGRSIEVGAQGIGASMGNIFNSLGSLIQQTGANAGTTATGIAQQFGVDLPAIWSSATTAISNANTATLSGMSSAWGGYVAFKRSLWNSMVSSLTATWNFFANGLRAAFNAIGTAWNTLVNAMVSVWRQTLAAIQGAISGLSNIIASVRNSLSSGLSNSLNTLNNAAVTVRNTIASWLKPIQDAIGGLKSAGNAISNVGGSIGSSVSSTVSQAPSWLGSLFKFERGGVLPGYSRTDDQLIMARSGEGILVPEAVRALGGPEGIERLNRSSEKGLPRFATGGVVGLAAGSKTQFSGILGAIAAITKSFPELQKVIQGLQKSVTTQGINSLGVAIGKLSESAKAAISNVVNTKLGSMAGSNSAPISAVARSLGSSMSDAIKPAIIAQQALQAGLTKVQTAYVLATAQHESDQFKVMREYGDGSQYEGRTDIGNTSAGDGVKYKGRGFVQLTGKANYAKYAQKLGIDLINRPELAEIPEIAAKILIDGMKTGAFTGVGLKDFSGSNYEGMRAIVNGSDRAGLIAGYARQYEKALSGITNIGSGVAGEVLNVLNEVQRVSTGVLGNTPKSLKGVLAKIPLQYRTAIEKVLNGTSKTLPQELAQWLNSAIPGVLKAGSIGADASRIVATARSWVGKEFNPGVFAQCAAFVRDVFAKSGLKLSETLSRSADGADYGVLEAGSLLKSSIGTIIKDKSKIIAGDIITWKKTYGNYGEDVTHVGIATGNGMMIDRSTSGAPVRERAIDTFGQFVAAIRPGGSADLSVNAVALRNGLSAIVDQLKTGVPEATLDLSKLIKSSTVGSIELNASLEAFKEKQKVDPIYGAALKSKLLSLGVSEEEAVEQSKAGAVAAVATVEKALAPTMKTLLSTLMIGVKAAFERAQLFERFGNQIERQLQRGDLSNAQRLRALPIAYQQMLGRNLPNLPEAPTINRIIDRLVQQPKAQGDLNIRLETRNIGGEQYVPLAQAQQAIQRTAKAVGGTDYRYSYSDRLNAGLG